MARFERLWQTEPAVVVTGVRAKKTTPLVYIDVETIIGDERPVKINMDVPGLNAVLELSYGSAVDIALTILQSMVPASALTEEERYNKIEALAEQLSKSSTAE